MLGRSRNNLFEWEIVLFLHRLMDKEIGRLEGQPNSSETRVESSTIDGDKRVEGVFDRRSGTTRASLQCKERVWAIEAVRERAAAY